jgi:signal transduction histidine kinase
VRILVIDDDPTVVAVLCRGLEGTDHHAIAAASGEEGLARFAAEAPDLVITDLVMPGVDGLEVVRRVKAASAGAAFLPVVVLTGHDRHHERIEGFSAGCDDYLSKPIHIDELRARVHSLLARRTQDIELRRANESLREMQRMRAELAALVVHDLRNPLSALRGNLELATEMQVGRPELVAEALRDCRELVDKTLSMVAGLLDVEQLEEGLLRANPREVPLVDLLAASIRPFERDAASRRVRVEVDVKPAGLSASLDEGLLRRALEGLVDNAIKYAPSGGRVVCGAVATGASGLEILVGNDGPTVPEADRERIFDKYFQIEARRRGARANRGLGLYFCKLAAEAHGGRVSVEERPGLPACFVLRIP